MKNLPQAVHLLSNAANFESRAKHLLALAAEFEAKAKALKTEAHGFIQTAHDSHRVAAGASREDYLEACDIAGIKPQNWGGGE